MRWIKCSDRLPDKDSAARMNGMYGVLYINGIYIQFCGKGFAHSYTHQSNNLSAIEWLDETTVSDEQDEWISVEDRKPEVKPGEDNSENVLVIADGKLMVMAYCYIDEGEDLSGWAWCNCYGDIFGDPEFDDNYNVTHWRPLPKPPKS